MKPAVISVSNALASPRLFAPHFAGESWSVWKAIIKATYAEPMSDAELALFHSVAGRDPPTKPVRELVAVAGRGAGKDSVASLIASVTAVNFHGNLRPGEKAIVMCLACDREQAKIVFNYTRAYFEQIPTLAKMATRITDDSIELSNNVVIEVHTNSYRSVRGRSLLCAIFDEVAFWRSEDSASPDFEVAGAIDPGLARIPGSTLILISSAHKRSGLLYQKWKDNYGRNNDDILVVRGTTLQFNPLFDAKIIARQLAADPQLYGAEYNSEWRDDLATFISRALLEAAVDTDVIVRPPQPDVQYFAFDYPSGGANDSYTLAIAHQDVRSGKTYSRSGLGVVLATESLSGGEQRSPRCCANIAANEVTGDDYGKRWVSDAYGQIGILRRKSEFDRSNIYLNVLPLFTSGRARLLDNQRLVNQFAGLERRTFPSGKDKVDHDRGHHDDLCNAAAGALVLASRRPPPEPPIVLPYFYGLHCGEIGHGVDPMPTPAPAPALPPTATLAPPPPAATPPAPPSPPVALEPVGGIPVLISPAPPPPAPPPVLSAAERQANADRLNSQPANPPGYTPNPWTSPFGGDRGGINSPNFSMRDRWSVNW